MKLVQLDLQYFAGEKTEKATPKKRNDSRKKGQVAKSQDVNTAIGILGIFFFFSIASPFLIENILAIFKHSFQKYMNINLSQGSLFLIFYEILIQVAKIVGPVMLVALVVGLISNYLQIGFLFTTETIQFKLEKLDPIKGFKRIFSLRAVIDFLKSTLKIIIVSMITFFVLWNRIDEILVLSQKTIGAGLMTIVDITVQMGLYAGGALLFLALLDYLYQKYDFEKKYPYV